MKYKDITRQEKVNGEMAVRSFSDIAFKAYSESSYEVAEIKVDCEKWYVIYMGTEIVTECDTFRDLEECFEEIYYNEVIA